MRILLLFSFLLLPAFAFCQISAAHQKALNSYVEYANQSGEEVTAVVKSIIEYFPKIQQRQSWGAPRYGCPVQLDDYYLNNALSVGKTLPPTILPTLNSRLQALRAAAEKIDNRCKALDTYHKLEDYKQDNFAKANVLINEIHLLVDDYIKARSALDIDLESAYKKLTPSVSQASYHKTEEMLRSVIIQEKKFLDLWKFNLNAAVHTGWVVEELEKSILQTDVSLQGLQKYKPVLQYPASSMWTSFQGSLGDVLGVKRSGLDRYNFEAKKSDEYSNDVYLALINYVNGTLVAHGEVVVVVLDDALDRRVDEPHVVLAALLAPDLAQLRRPHVRLAEEAVDAARLPVARVAGVDEGDAGGADRARERQAGELGRHRRGVDRDDVVRPDGRGRR